MKIRAVALAAVLACCSAAVQAQGSNIPPLVVDCGNPFVNAYGPFDYRTAAEGQKSIVEVNHFTPAVESLRTGVSGTIASDLDYTLRAFPNHPRALTAMVRLGKRDKTPQPRGAQWPVECYLERAIIFAPDDMTARQIRGTYFATAGRYTEAIRDLEAVIDKYPDNASAHYNLGLSHFELKDYDRALAEAKRAAALGLQLEGLKKKLKAAGKWVD